MERRSIIIADKPGNILSKYAGRAIEFIIDPREGYKYIQHKTKKIGNNTYELIKNKYNKAKYLGNSIKNVVRTARNWIEHMVENSYLNPRIWADRGEKVDELGLEDRINLATLDLRMVPS